MHIDYTINVANLLALAAAVGGFIWGARKVLVKLYLTRQEERLRARVRELKRLHGGFLLGGYITYSAVELGKQRGVLQNLTPGSRDHRMMQHMMLDMIACYSMLITRVAEDFPEFHALRAVYEASLTDFQLDLALERCLRVSNALPFFDVHDNRLGEQVRTGRACAVAFTLGADVLDNDDLYKQCQVGFDRLLAEEGEYPPADELLPLFRAFAERHTVNVEKLLKPLSEASNMSGAIQQFARYMSLCSQGYQEETARLSNRLRLLQAGTSMAAGD